MQWLYIIDKQKCYVFVGVCGSVPCELFNIISNTETNINSNRGLLEIMLCILLILLLSDCFLESKN